MIIFIVSQGRYVSRVIKQYYILTAMILKKYPSADLDKKSNLFFSIGLMASLLIVIIIFNWKTYDSGNLVDIGTVEDNFEHVMDIPPTQQPPPPPPAIQQPSIIEVPNEVEIEQEIEVSLDIEISEEQSVAPVVVEDIIFKEAPEEEVADEIFTVVEERPSFQGGSNAAFLKWVGERLVYPDKASRQGIHGRVYVQFVIEKDGSITDITVLKGIGGGADEEAVKVIQSAPKWSPGKQRGKPVRVKMVLPITFVLKT